MSKIAFLVESHFFSKHVGVRNYFLSLVALLEKTNHVDIISCYRDTHGDLSYYKIHFKNRNFQHNNGIAESLRLESAPAKMMELYGAKLTGRTVTENDFYYCQIGGGIIKEQYDTCFITNPWLIDHNERFPATKIYGIIYDTIPNEYAVTKTLVVMALATRHTRGFAYYMKYCDHIFAISEQAKNRFIRFFKCSQDKITDLPPLIPNGYFDYVPKTEYSGKNIMLAGPFDLRKGLKSIPAIVNPVGDQVDNLIIYGDIRCSLEDIITFFDEIKVKNIVWYPKALTTDIQASFEISKALLFPSLEEGLGLPIIESQLCGTPVLVRNQAPMNKLVLEGGFVMEDDELDKASLALESMLQNNFDKKALSKEAAIRFDPGKILEIFRSLDSNL